MLIGVPKEIKNHEYRIGLTPAGARELIQHGHDVIVQRDGGKSIGLTDELYEKAGATIIDTAEEIFARADMIIKVKEPQAVECAMLRPDQVLYTYLHLAPDPDQTAALVKLGCTAIAYETVEDAAAALAEASGLKVHRLSGATGKGVQEVLRALRTEIRAERTEARVA